MVSLRAEPPQVVEEEPELEWAEAEVAVAEVVVEPEPAVEEQPEPAVEEEPEPTDEEEREQLVEEEPEPPVEEEPEPPPTSRFVHPEHSPQEQSRFARSDEGGPVSLRSATFEDLRGLGMSVTQARRVLHYRDERGLDSVAGLEEVPGLPRDFRAELAQKLSD
jgi:hypothetical protein